VGKKQLSQVPLDLLQILCVAETLAFKAMPHCIDQQRAVDAMRTSRLSDQADEWKDPSPEILLGNENVFFSLMLKPTMDFGCRCRGCHRHRKRISLAAHQRHFRTKKITLLFV
jgi:hypothetical protein